MFVNFQWTFNRFNTSIFTGEAQKYRFVFSATLFAIHTQTQNWFNYSRNTRHFRISFSSILCGKLCFVQIEKRVIVDDAVWMQQFKTWRLMLSAFHDSFAQRGHIANDNNNNDDDQPKKRVETKWNLFFCSFHPRYVCSGWVLFFFSLSLYVGRNSKQKLVTSFK